MMHTKGPWKSGREDMQSYNGKGEPFTNIYHATLKDGEHMGKSLPLTIGRAEGENNKANARLMAAAPDLLDALRGILAGFETNVWGRNTEGDNDPMWAMKNLLPHLQALAKAQDVIAKIDGKDQG